DPKAGQCNPSGDRRWGDLTARGDYTTEPAAIRTYVWPGARRSGWEPPCAGVGVGRDDPQPAVGQLDDQLAALFFQRRDPLPGNDAGVARLQLVLGVDQPGEVRGYEGLAQQQPLLARLLVGEDQRRQQLEPDAHPGQVTHHVAGFEVRQALQEAISGKQAYRSIHAAHLQTPRRRAATA